MISSSSPSPSPILYSQHNSPRNNVWSRPLHPRSSSLSILGAVTTTGGRTSTTSSVTSEMKQAYSRSPRPTAASGQSPASARGMRNASTQWSSPETPELERSSVPGKRKARTGENAEVTSQAESPSQPRLASQAHAATSSQQQVEGSSSRPSTATQPVPCNPTEAADSSSTISSTQSAEITEDTPSIKRLRPADRTVKLLPAKYEDCPSSDLVPIISSMLMELIRHNDTPVTNTGLTRFHSRAPPGISVQDYLQRLAHHATLSPPILLCMVYYIDRLCAVWPKFTINSLTVHRYLIASATVASKGLSDSFWTNATYARVGGVSLKELALLELEFLWRIEWKIVPKPEVLVDYYRSLVQNCDGYEVADELGHAVHAAGIGAGATDSENAEMNVDADVSTGQS